MDNHLYILWTNADLLAAHKMVFMYGLNSKIKGWWEEVTIIIWGATAKLVAEDTSVQKKIKEMIDLGVKFSACKTCADQLNVAKNLESQGIEVIRWGEPLTKLIKEKRNLLSV